MEKYNMLKDNKCGAKTVKERLKIIGAGEGKSNLEECNILT